MEDSSIKYRVNNKQVLLISCIVALTGCISAKLLTPAQSDVDRVKDKFPNYSFTALNQGKTLYENHCGGCHSLKNPMSRNEAQWKEIVPPMVRKVNKKAMVLDAQGQEDILRYLITMSTASKQVK